MAAAAAIACVDGPERCPGLLKLAAAVGIPAQSCTRRHRTSWRCPAVGFDEGCFFNAHASTARPGVGGQSQASFTAALPDRGCSGNLRWIAWVESAERGLVRPGSGAGGTAHKPGGECNPSSFIGLSSQNSEDSRKLLRGEPVRTFSDLTIQPFRQFQTASTPRKRAHRRRLSGLDRRWQGNKIINPARILQGRTRSRKCSV